MALTKNDKLCTAAEERRVLILFKVICAGGILFLVIP